MSIAAMASCWGPDFPVETDGISSPVIRLVAIAVADMVSDGNNNEFFMATDKLADKVGMHRVTVTRVLGYLSKAQVLTVVSRSRYHPTRYRWTWLSVASGYTTCSQAATRTCSPAATQTQREPKKQPTNTGRWPGNTSQEPEMSTYGEDSDKVRVVSKRKADEWDNIGTDGDGIPAKVEKQPTAPTQSSARVIYHMRQVWPEVVVVIPAYRNHKLVDVGGRDNSSPAFASYLNDNFFGPNAKTPMSPEQVISIVDRFMKDLQRKQFRLKDGQPVWLAFTRRWQNYPVKTEPSAAQKEMRAGWTVVGTDG